MHIHIHKYIYTYTYTCLYIYTHIRVHVYTYSTAGTCAQLHTEFMKSGGLKETPQKNLTCLSKNLDKIFRHF